jgi:hypothetical protein
MFEQAMIQALAVIIKKAAPLGPLCLSRRRRHERPATALSGCFQVARRLLATLGDNFVANALTLGQSAHASLLYSADMNENILVTFFRLDESETLCRVKPLYSSNSHVWPPIQ